SPPLVVTDGAWRRQAPTVAASPTEPLWHIADAAATLIATGDRRRFKACSGHDCILHFLDTSRNGTRRWCSMAGCGNRSKVASHYRRSRG
ncbi:MAG: CGNR zinc finger domain-containing protein, partial [Planctomycetota bacterium]